MEKNLFGRSMDLELKASKVVYVTIVKWVGEENQSYSIEGTNFSAWKNFLQSIRRFLQMYDEEHSIININCTYWKGVSTLNFCEFYI